jgi:glycosyltransferase involved in cell wall biosynthesis
MSGRQKSVCLISSRINVRDLPLQPWRYLHEVACQLSQQGHTVTIITDGEEDDRLYKNEVGVQFYHLPSVGRPRWQQNRMLQQAIENIRPDVILWHVGIPTFFHQRLDGWGTVPVIGIFPGLVYNVRNFKQVGLHNLINEFSLIWIHLLGLITPRRLLRRPIEKGWFTKLVTLTHKTREQLIQLGLPPQSIHTISPGVDDIWFRSPSSNGDAEEMRTKLGFQLRDKIILYFGSPQPLRGLHDLIRAIEIAHQSDSNLKLLILSRQREDEFLKENAGLKQLLDHSPIRQNIKVVSGFLNPEKLVDYISLSHAVALPFQLVPSDAPLSLLEAQAQRKPVITTRVASLPEMVSGGEHYLADPANPVSLAQAVLAAAEAIGEERDQHGQKIQKLSPSLKRWQQVGAEWSQLIQSL